MGWDIFWIAGTAMFAGLALLAFGRVALAWSGHPVGRAPLSPHQVRRDLLLGLVFCLYTVMALLRLLDHQSRLSIMPLLIALPITWVALRGGRWHGEPDAR